jgi:hypothetical protein
MKHDWIDVVIITIITSPGVIAAFSSLRNGKILKQNGTPAPADQSISSTKPTGKTVSENADWYKPPDLGA